MSALLFALLGVALPWASGALLLAAVWPPAQGRPSWQMAAAYGFPLGVITLVLWMSLLAAAGVPFSVWAVGSAPSTLGLLAVYVLRTWRAPAANTESEPGPPGWQALPRWGQVLWWALLALLLLRGAQFLMELLWRPSFGWDAWAHWATKAKVWYSLGTIVPFGSAAEVLADTAAYTDANPGYPRAIPLLQVWMALCAGPWDDTLINLPWLAFAVALGLGFHAQVRAAGAGPLFAMAASYVLLSLPFLGVHVALPGYADLPLAVFIGLASFAFWRWSMERRSGQLILALLLAASSPMIKTPGWIWLGLLLPALLPVVLGVRGWKALLGLGAAGATALFLMAHYHPRLLGYELHTNFHPVGQALLETTLMFGNWHLLWLGAPLLVLASWRDLANPRVAALTAYLGGGLAFLLVVFFFSNAALWVTDFSTVNRALLHLVPTLVFYCALLALGLRERLHAASATVAPTPAEAPPTPE